MDIDEIAVVKTMVWYHDKCADGLMAAAIVFSEFDHAALSAVQYGDITPVNIDAYAEKVRGNILYMVDFSVPPDLMERLAAKARRIVWIDHHKTAFEQYGYSLDENICDTLFSGKVVVHLDNRESGASLTWRIMKEGPLPRCVELVRDHDLWEHKFPETKPFVSGLYALHGSYFNPVFWAGYLHSEELLTYLIGMGEVQYEIHMREVKELAEHKMTVYLGMKRGVAVNVPHKYASELGHFLCEQGAQYAAVWMVLKDKVVVSLRSQGDFDVSRIAKLFGGGGHKNAAGFEMPLEQWLLNITRLGDK